ncbi:MAG: hypothetical protein IPP34_17545 [Bacteroidetes bacterium]|nr:hypothetical protein [Bacteroidota bacterium]
MTPAQFNLAVSDNTISANDNSVFADGISFNNASNFTAIGNSVSGDGSTASANSFRFMMSPEGVIHNNYSTGTQRGFSFKITPSIVQFRNNTMNVNWHGLELDPTAIIGIQDHTANNWTGYNLGSIPYEDISGVKIGAFNFNLTNDGIQYNQFIVDDTHAIGTVRYPNFEPPIGSFAFDWFDPNPGTETIPYYTQCSVSREMDSELTEIDSLVVIDSIELCL